MDISSAHPRRQDFPDSRSLADHHIVLKRHGPGEHRAACPECAKAKPRPGDTALAVKVDDKGATWTCHRCSWAGALNQHRETSRPHRTAAPAAPDPSKERNRELAKEIW